MSTNSDIPNASIDASAEIDGSLLLSLKGSLQATTIHVLWKEALEKISGLQSKQGIVLDASQVTYCDGAGIGMIVDLEESQKKRGGTFRIEGLDSRFQLLLDQFSDRSFAQSTAGKAKCRHLPEVLGEALVNLAKDVFALVSFIGELVFAVLWAIAHPKQLRWRDVFLTCENVGANALPIVALISFLIGLIIAFQAAIPLGQFGAQNFVADLVAVSLVRELGPLMTAIILAGRSGASFAAEIGTMKVNEEINALTTMGLEPVRFLVVARVAAAVVMMPILTIFSLVFGLLGGGIVYLSLGFSYVLYCHQVIGALDLADLAGGLFKAAVFGLLVAAVGCFRGLQTENGASAVGLSTTRAVVSGITLIVIADGIFSVTFFLLGI